MGYADPAQTGRGLHLRLYSRAFIVRCNATSRPIVFINLDAGMSSQVLKTEVVRRLKSKFGKDQFDHQNVMISATHTHSGPGGFFQYLLFDITTHGFSYATFNAMVSGILQVIHSTLPLRSHFAFRVWKSLMILLPVVQFYGLQENSQAPASIGVRFPIFKIQPKRGKCCVLFFYLCF